MSHADFSFHIFSIHSKKKLSQEYSNYTTLNKKKIVVEEVRTLYLNIRIHAHHLYCEFAFERVCIERVAEHIGHGHIVVIIITRHADEYLYPGISRRVCASLIISSRVTWRTLTPNTQSSLIDFLRFRLKY